MRGRNCRRRRKRKGSRLRRKLLNSRSSRNWPDRKQRSRSRPNWLRRRKSESRRKPKKLSRGRKRRKSRSYF